MAEELTPAEEAVVEVEEAAEIPAELGITEEPAAEEPVITEEPAAKKPLGGKKTKAAAAEEEVIIEEVAQPAAVEPPAAQEFTLPSVSHGVISSTHIAVSHRNR